MNDIAISKRLSYVLRHRPDSIGITLPADGWVEVETLLAPTHPDRQGYWPIAKTIGLSPVRIRSFVYAGQAHT